MKEEKTPKQDLSVDGIIPNVYGITKKDEKVENQGYLKWDDGGASGALPIPKNYLKKEKPSKSVFPPWFVIK